MRHLPTLSLHSLAGQNLFSYSRIINDIEQRDYSSVLFHVFMFSVGSALHDLSYSVYDDKFVARACWIRSLRGRF